ncbi:peroxidase family protein, partial [Pseudonocardia pini]|uniref:peroxidase family protein n=1 Tax=Pseudonocardia pini TaxID=2758030 RepID=UPI001C69119D
PDPIVVADRLLARREFVPAPTLNVLAASWIQFQVHDWVHHERDAANPVRLPVPEGRSWRNHPHDTEDAAEMLIAADREPELNTTTHWWDASGIYGTDEAAALALRTNGGSGDDLELEEGHLPIDDEGLPRTGFGESWWLGLSAMQTLFAREHNAVCAALRAEYPTLSAERRYQVARLVVSALIAKIHTVEWTPAVLGTDVIDQALTVNWRGAQDHLVTRFGLNLLDPHAVHGIPGSKPAHDRVPFALTEEFVTVYRLHPLIPDTYVVGDEVLTFAQIQGAATEAEHRKLGLPTVVSAFARAHPGAVALHNFPDALRAFERDGELVDLAVVDIVRTRMRGVPRYNEFRTALHRPPLRTFEELSDDPETVATLTELYGTVDRVDTVVGLLAEQAPPGFGFSDTAFRIFLLMASRRLQSDRFLTVDYRPEVYTELGLDWVERGSMAEVIRRHCGLVGVPGGKAV